MQRFFGHLIVTLCAIVNFMTGIIVPLAYLTAFGQLEIDLPYIGPFSFITQGLVGMAAYMVLNVITGFARPGDSASRKSDFLFSVFAAIGIVGTAIAVFGFGKGEEFWGDIPNAKIMLALLTLYAIVVDLVYNQLPNWKEVLKLQTVPDSVHPANMSAGGRAGEAVDDLFVTRRVIHRTAYYEQLPDGTLVPDTNPREWLVGHADRYWDEDPTPRALPSGGTGPAAPGTT